MKNARAFSKLSIMRRPEWDFSDDGTRFYGYEYKNLPITYAKAGGEMYFSMRPDYIKDFSYIDYREKNWYMLCDKFNGVDEIDPEELINALEIVVAGIANLRNEIASATIDFAAVNACKEREIAMIDAAIKKVKNEFNWLDAEAFAVNAVRESVKYLKDYRTKLERLEEENTRYMRDIAYRVKTSGYIFVFERSYMFERLNGALEKSSM